MKMYAHQAKAPDKGGKNTVDAMHAAMHAAMHVAMWHLLSLGALLDLASFKNTPF